MPRPGQELSYFELIGFTLGAGIAYAADHELVAFGLLAFAVAKVAVRTADLSENGELGDAMSDMLDLRKGGGLSFFQNPLQELSAEEVPSVLP